MRADNESPGTSSLLAAPGTEPTVGVAENAASGSAKELGIQRSLFGEILDWMLMPLLLL